MSHQMIALTRQSLLANCAELVLHSRSSSISLLHAATALQFPKRMAMVLAFRYLPTPAVQALPYPHSPLLGVQPEKSPPHENPSSAASPRPRRPLVNTPDDSESA